MSTPCCEPKSFILGDEEERDQKSLKLQFVFTSLCFVALSMAWIGNRLNNHFPKGLEGFLYMVAYVTGCFFPTCGVFTDLRSSQFNVNFLMVAAALGAALIGQVVEGAILMFLFSLSGALERFVSGRTRKAIRALMKLSPSEATVLRENR